jgi:hypothetical protein
VRAAQCLDVEQNGEDADKSKIPSFSQWRSSYLPTGSSVSGTVLRDVASCGEHMEHLKAERSRWPAEKCTASYLK